MNAMLYLKKPGDSVVAQRWSPAENTPRGAGVTGRAAWVCGFARVREIKTQRFLRMNLAFEAAGAQPLWTEAFPFASWHFNFFLCLYFSS